MTEDSDPAIAVPAIAGRVRPDPRGPGLALTTSPNLRDLGGWLTSDGRRVVSGAVYRSTDLSRLAGPDALALADLGLRAVFDLRTDGERVVAPDLLPAGAALLVLDVLADSTTAVPASLMALLADPPRATAKLSADRVSRMFDGAYREIVTLPSARVAYGALFHGLATGRLPALIHCTAGKDRTGWAAAALLRLLGVSREDVMAEYLLTNEMLLPALAPMIDEFRAAGGDPSVLPPVLGVDAAYLAAALDEVTIRFGSMDGYFTDGLGLDRATITALRTTLTEPRD